jgi:hypothetical protein
MNLDEAIKYLIWIVLFIILSGGLYAILGKIGVI